MIQSITYEARERKRTSGVQGVSGVQGTTGPQGVQGITGSIGVTQLSQLSDDATHRVVTDVEKSTWDNKSDNNLVIALAVAL